MCEFCTKHGDGKIWFKNAKNYAQDLMSDINRRGYIKDFFTATMDEGVKYIGRLETIYQKKKRLPRRLIAQMEEKAKAEHFGQVVTIEEVGEIVAKAATVVRLPCACRWAAMKSENRCCYSVSYTAEAWYHEMDMGYFGLSQDEGLESVSRAAAVGQMQTLEKEGAVHTIWTMITPFIGAICNCRPDECLGLRTLSVGVAGMFRGEHVARVDEKKCIGCGACEAACHFEAVSAYTAAGAAKAVIEPERCYGCGLCRNACPTDALTMVPR
jgi:ferredoxin